MYTTTTTSSLSPASDYIINSLEPNMLTVGWVKASTNVTVNTGNASNTLIWNVYKSPSGNNSISKDFYLAIGWDNASNANIAMTMFENWNSGSNTCSGYAPFYAKLGAASIQSPNNWCNNNFSPISGDPTSNVAYCITTATNTLSKTSQICYHSVTIDRVVTFSANSATLSTGHAYYGGVYDRFLSVGTDTFPIALVNFVPGFGSMDTNGANQTNISGFTIREYYSSSYAWSAGTGIPLNPISIGTEVYSNRNTTSRAMLAGGYSQASTLNMRGLLKDIYYCNLTGNIGDTISVTISGVAYTATLIRTGTMNNSVGACYGYVLQV
jgi:hypothetical protein